MNQSNIKGSNFGQKQRKSSNQVAIGQQNGHSCFGATILLQCGGKLQAKKGYIGQNTQLPSEVPIIQLETNEESNYILQADGQVYQQKLITVKKNLDDNLKQNISQLIDNNNLDSLQKVYQYSNVPILQSEEVIKNTGWTAIQKCCQLGHVQILEYLLIRLKHEVTNKQELCQILGLKNKMGKTALMICAWADQPECLKLLLKCVQKVEESKLLFSEEEQFLLQQTDSGSSTAYKISKTGTNSCRQILEERDQYYSYHVNLNKKNNSMAFVKIPEFNDPIVKIAAGYKHMLALDVKGKVWSWGNNDLGQLGKGDRRPYTKPTKILSLDKEFICQIFVFGNCNFVINQKGMAFSWGDNGNFQLGITGQLHEEPKIMNNDPWDEYCEELQNITLGKDNFKTYFKDEIFKHQQKEKQSAQDLTPKQNNNSKIIKSKQSKILEEQLNEMEYNYKDLKTRKKALEKQIQEIQTEIYGDNKEDNEDDENVGKDREKQIINDLDHLIQELKSQYFEINAQQNLIEGEIKYIQNDLDQLKEQLLDIQSKEQALVDQYTDLEEQIRILQRKNSQNNSEKLTQKQQDDIQKQKEINAKKVQNMQRQLKTVKEILNANENVKNAVIKKQNQNEDGVQEKKRQLEINLKKIEDINKKQKTYEELLSEKNAKQKVAFVENNKGQLEKSINKYNTYQKYLQDTQYNEIADKAPENLNGLQNIIESSDQLINQVKNELVQNKLNTKDPSQDGINKFVELIQDNILIRQQQNNTIMALIIQSNYRYVEMEEELQQFYNKNSLNIVDDKNGYQKYLSSLKKIIKIDPKKLQSKSYQRQIEQENKIADKEKKKRGLFCF